MKHAITNTNVFKPIILTLIIENPEEFNEIYDDLGNTGAWSNELYEALTELKRKEDL